MIKDREKSEKELEAFTNSMKEMQKELGGICKFRPTIHYSLFIIH